MSHSQFHSTTCLYLDMHGLIFRTSIWLLAGSTRYLIVNAKALHCDMWSWMHSCYMACKQTILRFLSCSFSHHMIAIHICGQQPRGPCCTHYEVHFCAHSWLLNTMRPLWLQQGFACPPAFAYLGYFCRARFAYNPELRRRSRSQHQSIQSIMPNIVSLASNLFSSLSLVCTSCSHTPTHTRTTTR